MTRSRSSFVLSLLAAPAFGAAARADSACAPDVARLCGGVKPGQGRKIACLKQHEGEVSDPCRQEMAAVRQAIAEIHESCRPDAERLCQEVPPGEGRIAACLKSHQADLSAACRDAVARGKELRDEIHPGCRPDAERFCQAIKPGGGRILACLQSHEAQLTPACKAKLERRR